MNVKHIVGTVSIVALSSGLYTSFASSTKIKNNNDNVTDRKMVVDRALKLKGLQDKSYTEATIEMYSIANCKKENINNVRRDSLKNEKFIKAIISYIEADREDE